MTLTQLSLALGRALAKKVISEGATPLQGLVPPLLDALGGRFVGLQLGHGSQDSGGRAEMDLAR